MSPAPSRAPAVGDVVLDHYRLESELGQGSTGVVYRARKLPSDARVAIKILFPEAKEHPEAVRMFLDQAKTSAELASPHVAKVLDVGTLADGIPYVVTELLEGNDLAALVRRRGNLPIAEAVDYVIQATEAIAAAHAQGLVHLDLKPTNLFLTWKTNVGGKSNIIKVLDFGAAKIIDATQSQSAATTGTTLKSPRYMSPEQLRNAKDLDGRADIWSLGVILYELIAGKPPFHESGSSPIFVQIMTGGFEPLRTTRPKVSDVLENIVACCLRKSRGERFADVVQLAQALAPFASPDGAARARRLRDAHAARGGQEAPAATEAPQKDHPEAPASFPAFAPIAAPDNPHELPPLPLPPSQQDIMTVPSSDRIRLAKDGIQVRRPASAPPERGPFEVEIRPRSLKGIAVGIGVVGLAGIGLITLALRGVERPATGAESTEGSRAAPAPSPLAADPALEPSATFHAPPAEPPRPQAPETRATNDSQTRANAAPPSSPPPSSPPPRSTSSILEKRK
jgi:serine/threonine-protein kinase